MVDKAAAKDNRLLYGLIAVLVLALLFIVYNSYIATGQKTAKQEAAVDKVKKIYETITEGPVEVLNVKEESGMYRVILATRDASGSRQVQEILVSSDGALFTDRAVNTQAFLERITKEKSFAECLAGKQLLVFGQINEVNTQAQLQVLGSFYRKFYVDCTGANLQLCQQVGITQVPTTVYNNTPYIGVQALQLYEQLTGCAMD
ncbi:MAG: hypothetical protein HYW26_00500 [Candidatus Aenigmarchaeota archaeon]|nr:hypothetical protein [Candidatus Aenigmarchaeota archaeon]